MALYMLDTNMCIYLMKHQPPEVVQRFAQCYVGDVVMSAITYAELEYGVSVASNSTKERQYLASLVEDIPVVPFECAAEVAYGPIRPATRERNKALMDKLIAAHAVSLDVVLVANNERDFLSFPGLKVENWVTN